MKKEDEPYDPAYKAWLAQEKGRTQAIVQMKKSLPSIVGTMVALEAGFTSFMCFIGQDGDYVANLRKTDDDGLPVVCWATGETAITALLALDARIDQDAFKPDTSR